MFLTPTIGVGGSVGAILAKTKSDPWAPPDGGFTNIELGARLISSEGEHEKPSGVTDVCHERHERHTRDTRETDERRTRDTPLSKPSWTLKFEEKTSEAKLRFRFF